MLLKAYLQDELWEFRRITYGKEKMKIETFEEDLLNLEGFAEKLENFIKVEHRYVPESLVVSLNGGFGSGKSTFFKMWTDRLAKNYADNKLSVVEVNAWNDDYCGDPLISLVTSLIESLNKGDKDTKILLEAAKDVGWFLTGIGSQVVSTLTGIDPVSAGELAEKKKVERKGRQDFEGNYFDIYKAKKNALKTLKNSIKTFISGDNPNILILVDELDRCRPDYAISYLETIKHVFDIKGIAFIIAVDRKQLECSAKAAFGDIDFPEYYRKFVQREIALPKPVENGYKRLISSYVDYYLEREKERYCYMALDPSRITNIERLIVSMNMTPRQVQEVFRIMGHVLATEEEKRGKIYWCLAVGTILMSALRVGNTDIYEKLARRELGISEAVTFFKKIDKDNVDFWFALCLTGGGLNPEQIKGKQVVDIYREVGFIQNDSDAEEPNLNSLHNGWGHRDVLEKIPQIHLMIEQISSWD